MHKKLICLLVTLGLFSCSENTMQAHSPLPPKQFPSSNKDYIPIENISCLAWWKQFHDVELNQLIEKGLKNNMDIHVAIGNLKQAQGELRQV